MIFGNVDESLVKAIQKAASEAAEKGVSVTVEIHEQGTFGERLDVTIVALPPKRKE